MASCFKPRWKCIYFQISQENTAAIFGISFWAHKDCPLLISHLKQKAAIYDIQDPGIFWDNNIIEILDRISVKTYEISADVACEMNTYEEYKFAQDICKSAIYGSLFFDNVTLRTENDIHFKIFIVQKRKQIFIGLTNYLIIMEKNCLKIVDT